MEADGTTGLFENQALSREKKMDLEAKLKEGEDLFHAGMMEEAEGVFQGILDIEPNNIEALNNLGVLHLVLGSNKKSEQFFLKALELNNNHLNTLENLTDLYEHESQWEKAAAYLTRLLDLKGDDGELRDRLGRLEKLVEDKKRQARQQCEEKNAKIETAGTRKNARIRQQGSFNASFLEIDITPNVSPAKPLLLQGMAGAPRKAASVQAPLKMQLLLIEDSNFAKVLIIGADIFGFGKEIVSRVRQMAEPWGIPPEAVLLNASHTHYAPGTVSNVSKELGPFYPQYAEAIANAVGSGLESLFNTLEKCEIQVGHTEFQIGLNRRLPQGNKVVFAPNKNGFYDAYTPFIHIDLSKSQKKVLLINHGCHPTGLGNLHSISSDFVHYLRESLKEKGTADGVMFLQGAAGSSKEAASNGDGQTAFSNSADDAKANGTAMAEKIASSVKSNLVPVKGTLFCTSCSVSLPLKPLPDVNELRRLSESKETPSVVKEWAKRSLETYSEVPPPSDVNIELQTVSIGKQARLMGIPGEPVAELGPQLRSTSTDFSETFVLGYTNGLLGYLPTDAMIKEGGYEPKDSSFYYLLPAPLDSGAEPAIIQASKSCFEKERAENEANRYGRYHLTQKKRQAFFVLSSGRCGTKSLARLLDTATNARVWHHPKPFLINETLAAYRGEIDLDKTLWASRGQIMFKSWSQGLVHGETDLNMTPFAPAIASELPESRFLILVRDPRDFVRSGMRRNYYQGHPWDSGRLRPKEGTPEFEEFNRLDQFEKICWLWAETYRRIEEIADTIGRERIMTVKFEDLISGTETIEKAFQFLGLEGFDPTKIKKELETKHNAQTTGQFPKPDDWPQELHGKLSRQCRDLAKYYTYDVNRPAAETKEAALENPMLSENPLPGLETDLRSKPRGALKRGTGCYIAKGTIIKCPFQIGNYSNIMGPAVIKGDRLCRLGNYCALGWGIHIITSSHDSNHANLQIDVQQRHGFKKIWISRGEVNIGHNVWIGDNAVILSGVTIGDGAIVGAGAVVTKNVPSFGVAVGNPARIVKMRFSKKIISQLLEIRWWHWPEDRIGRNKDFFEMDLAKNPDADLFSIIIP